MALNVVEAHVRDAIKRHYPDRRLTIGRTANLTEAKPDQGRVQCQNRAICARGCSFGAYFSTQSSTLPAAQATGNLTLLTDSLVETINYDASRRRVDSVNVLNRRTRSRTRYTGKVVFLCAGAFNSVALLLRSASEAFPKGLANSSGVLGHYIMDHANTVGDGRRDAGLRLSLLLRQSSDRCGDPALQESRQQGRAVRARLLLPGRGLPCGLDAGSAAGGPWRGLQEQPARARRLEVRSDHVRRMPAARGESTLARSRKDR